MSIPRSGVWSINPLPPPPPSLTLEHYVKRDSWFWSYWQSSQGSYTVGEKVEKLEFADGFESPKYSQIGLEHCHMVWQTGNLNFNVLYYWWYAIFAYRLVHKAYWNKVPIFSQHNSLSSSLGQCLSFRGLKFEKCLDIAYLTRPLMSLR